MTSIPPLSLDCLTLTDTSPVDLVKSAGSAGFELVTVWTNPRSAFPLQPLTPAMAGECIRALEDYGVSVHAIEAFELSSCSEIDGYRPALELGAWIGGKTVLVYHGGVPDRSEAADLLAYAVQVAGEFGLAVNLEPISMGMTRTVQDGLDLIGAAGVNAGIVFDTVHFMRSGGTVRDLDDIDPAIIRHVQINDGPAHLPPDQVLTEAMSERMLPGEGEFPLVDLLRRVPADIPWGIEAPRTRSADAGKSSHDQASEAIAAMRRLLHRLGATAN